MNKCDKKLRGSDVVKTFFGALLVCYVLVIVSYLQNTLPKDQFIAIMLGLPVVLGIGHLLIFLHIRIGKKKVRESCVVGSSSPNCDKLCRSKRDV